jgi:hypothetical protein
MRKKGKDVKKRLTPSEALGISALTPEDYNDARAHLQKLVDDDEASQRRRGERLDSELRDLAQAFGFTLRPPLLPPDDLATRKKRQFAESLRLHDEMMKKKRKRKDHNI